MNACSPGNPNICLDCAALTLDDSPSTLPGQTEVRSAPQEPGGYGEQTSFGGTPTNPRQLVTLRPISNSYH